MSPDLYDRGETDGGMRGHLKVMRTITGHAPDTCPWRVMYAPLVREVIAAMEYEENGNLSVGIGQDPPALLVDAVAEYKRSLRTTLHEDQKIAHEKAKAEREAKRTK